MKKERKELKKEQTKEKNEKISNQAIEEKKILKDKKNIQKNFKK